MSKEVIYVDIKDDVTSIIDKIKKSEHKIIALVPPKQIGVLQSAVNLQLLAHSARQVKKAVVLVTNQEALMRLSAVAKIPIARTLTSRPEMFDIPALKVDGDDDIIDGAQIAVGEHAGLEMEQAADEKTDAKTEESAEKLAPVKIKVPNYDKFRKKLFLGGLGVLLLISFTVWALVFAPRAEVTLTTNTRAVNISSSVTFVEKTDQTNLEKNLIYAQTQKSSRKRSYEFVVTGEKEIKTKATGTATIMKSTGGSAKTIAAGTVIATRSGLKFVTTETVAVPPASLNENNEIVPGRKTVAVQAAEVGESYNIPAQAMTMADGSLRAEIGQTSGGSDRKIKVATQEDFDKANAELAKDTHDSAVKELRNKFDSSMLVIEDSLVTSEGEIVASSKVNEEAKDGKVKLEQEVNYQISAVARKTLEEYINYIALKENASDKTKQRSYDSGIGQVVFKDFVTKDGVTSVRISSQVQIGPDIDKNEVTEFVKGKTYGEIEDYYSSIDGVKEVDVKLSPFWVKAVPKNTDKITIFIKS